jgi:outer membrane usher protein
VRSIALLGAWFVFLTAMPVAAQERGLWAVVLNETEQEDTYLVTTPEGAWISVSDLEAMGLQGFAGRRGTFFGAPHVLLSSLAPDIVAAFDERNLVLTLTASASLFAATSLSVLNPRPDDIEFIASPSTYLNYRLFWIDSAGLSGSADAGFSVKGFSVVSQASVANGGAVTRGLTTLTADAPGRRLRVQGGDVFAHGTAGLAGGGLVGGVSISRDNSLDPYFRPYATPTFTGAVQVPSIAQLYINGELQRQFDLPPGAFSIGGLPVTEGNGAITVRVRDSMGQVREFRQPYYLATTLLSKGEQDFHYAGGLERTDDDKGVHYGDWLFTGSHRVGLADRLTAGIFVEGNPKSVASGLTVAFAVPRVGQFAVEGSASRDQDGIFGSAAAGNWQLVARHLSFSLAGSWHSKTYYGLNQPPSARARPWNAGLVMSVTLPASIGVFLQAGIEQEINVQLPDYSVDPYPVALKKPKYYNNKPTTVLVQSTVSRTGAGVQLRPLRPVNLQASGFYVKNLLTGKRWWETSVSVTWAVGRGVAASSAWRRDRDGDLAFTDINRSLSRGTGVGFRLRTTGETPSDLQRVDLDVEAQTSMARMGATIERSHTGEFTTGARLEGGIVQVGKALALSRPVSQSFAFVRVPDGPGVTVYRDHDSVGRTGRFGRLLVPDLQAYYGNVLGVEDTDLPLDLLIDRTQATIAPPYRGGSTVTFNTRRIRAYRGTVRLDPWPADKERYGTLRLRRGQVQLSSPLGSDGSFYFDTAEPGTYDADIEMGDTDCHMQVTLPKGTEMITTLDELVCRVKPGGGAQ